jgi:hypothetical protein
MKRLARITLAGLLGILGGLVPAAAQMATGAEVSGHKPRFCSVHVEL